MEIKLVSLFMWVLFYFLGSQKTIKSKFLLKIFKKNNEKLRE